MTHRIISYVMLAVAGTLALLLLAAHIERNQLDRALGEYVKGALIGQGFHEGRRGKVRIVSLPRGATPVAVVEGSVRYPPIRGSGGAGDGSGAATPSFPPLLGGSDSPGPTTFPCSLDDLSLDVRCRAEIVEAAGKPWARLLVSGQANLYGQTRDFPESQAGDVDLVVAPTAIVPRWRAEARAGLEVSRDGRAWPVVGASLYGRSKVGAWGQVGTESVSIGVAYRIR